MTCSARSFSDARQLGDGRADLRPATAPRGRVPLIGRVSTSPSRETERKRSGELPSTARPAAVSMRTRVRRGRGGAQGRGDDGRLARPGAAQAAREVHLIGVPRLLVVAHAGDPVQEPARVVHASPAAPAWARAGARHRAAQPIAEGARGGSRRRQAHGLGSGRPGPHRVGEIEMKQRLARDAWIGRQPHQAPAQLVGEPPHADGHAGGHHAVTGPQRAPLEPDSPPAATGRPARCRSPPRRARR